MGHLRHFDLDRLCRDYGCRHIVETGTGSGDGLAYAAARPFATLHSIEIHADIAAAARRRFDADGRIRIHLGNSTEQLPKILAELPTDEPILFWLDAHFPGADLGFAAYDAEPDVDIRLPLERELEIIARFRPGASDVFLIDDLRIYEEGPFENGNIPDWAQTLPPTLRHLQFVERLFAATHSSRRDYADEGYLLLVPARSTSQPSVAAGPAVKECGKAVFRRMFEPSFAARYFVGRGLDVGSGDDPLASYAQFFPQVSGVASWDLEQGDAQFLQGIPDDHYDFVHSSHCLEHMVDPAIALASWFRVVRPGGHLVVVVPDEDLYEQGQWPSTFNGDHKHTFTISKTRSWSPVSRNLIDLVLGLGPRAEIRKLALLDATFREDLPRFDQTMTPIGESAIEVVIRKRPEPEVRTGGRTPPHGELTATQRAMLETATPGQDLSPLRSEATRLGRELDEALRQADGLRRELDQMRTSSSWRITEPLRRAVRAVRGLRTRE
ncbi:MAG: class I SAM-dependent methyltransferase [Alphaproteobacteria bacterium]|nr:class I SAM-dependent methyltransferase [Alphaproteobacteria bacterium]